MLITCPECQFARNINTDSIPATAQLATCPRCKSKFRFRVLDDEAADTDSVPEVTDAKNAGRSEAVRAATAGASQSKAAKAAGARKNRAVKTEANSADEAVEEYIESAMVAAMQDEIEELLRAEVVDAARAEVPATPKEATQRVQPSQMKPAHPAPSTEPPKANISKEVHTSSNAGKPASTAGAKKSAAEPVADKRASSSEAQRAYKQQSVQSTSVAGGHGTHSAPVTGTRESGHVFVQDTAAEEAAVSRYAHEQNSTNRDTAAAHIVPNAEKATDIWDAIAAMGGEHECTETFAPGCGAQVHIIPWEDGRLGAFNRLFSTFSSVLRHPVRFWRGVNAKPSAILPFLFYILLCALSCAALSGWGYVLLTYWSSVVAAVQTVLPEMTLLPQELTVSQLAQLMPEPEILAAIGAGILALPFIVGAVTHACARLVGGDPVPFSTGIKCASYSFGAFLGLLLPIPGLLVLFVYFPLLYISGVRIGYNLSSGKTIVFLLTVCLLLAASAFGVLAAGVRFM